MALTNLKHLDLSSNKIQTIDFQSNKLERLVYLNLNDNQIWSIKGIEELLVDDLLLDGNCLVGFECAVKRVSMDDNSLKQFDIRKGLCDLSIGGSVN
jgi:Leucine-rich repeat (LRR) protein